jgi:hypothetical protein
LHRYEYLSLYTCVYHYQIKSWLIWLAGIHIMLLDGWTVSSWNAKKSIAINRLWQNWFLGLVITWYFQRSRQHTWQMKHCANSSTWRAKIISFNFNTNNFELFQQPAIFHKSFWTFPSNWQTCYEGETVRYVNNTNIFEDIELYLYMYHCIYNTFVFFTLPDQPIQRYNIPCGTWSQKPMQLAMSC